MKTRRIVSFIALLVLAYVLFGIWIARDTKLILQKGMSNDMSHTEYMNEEVYQRLNPAQNGTTTKDYLYEPESHTIKMPFPLHLFTHAKVFVTHHYNSEDFGFIEPVTLNVELKKGKWVATKVKVEP